MCSHISTCISSVPCKSKMNMRSTRGEDVPRCIMQAACVARMKGKHSGCCMSKNIQRPFCVFKTEAGRDGIIIPARLFAAFCGGVVPRCCGRGFAHGLALARHSTSGAAGGVGT